jgi:MFS family permease
VAGRLADRYSIPALAALSFVGLALFAGLLRLADDLYGVLACFALYGVAMGGVGVCWTLGPVHFAGNRNAARYMGVHFALVGARAPIGFPLGGWLATRFGASAAFTGSMLIMLLGVLTMVRLARREREVRTPPSGLDAGRTAES